MPTTSVIIPVYNGARYLRQALDSVIAQDHPIAEIIVVDDGSTDASGAIAESYGFPVRTISQANAGIGAARNTGLAEARGERIAFLDSDDVWPPGRLALLANALGRENGTDLVFGFARQFLSPELPPEVAAGIRCPQTSQPGLIAGAMLADRDAFRRAGLFPVGRRVGEFIEWFVRAREAGVRHRMISEVVLLRRLHGENHGVRNRDAYGDYVRIVREALARQRAGGDHLC